MPFFSEFSSVPKIEISVFTKIFFAKLQKTVFNVQNVVPASCLIALCIVSSVDGAMDPRFEIDPQSLAVSSSPVKAAGKPVRRISHASMEKSSADVKGTAYTVKPGDHLFKILMRDYGLSNNEAESFIEEIKRENNIYDIKRLKIGQKIIIPPVRRRADGSLKLIQPLNSTAYKSADADLSVRQSFVLESPIAHLDSQEALGRVREAWDRIVLQKADPKPLSLQTSTFSLTLDPQRYPMFATMDGARILLDQNSSIPPLVKSLIEEKDSNIRIINYSDAGTKQFMSAMLESGGFYSVEENFSMDFGTDPKLTVQSDFKIEKTPESLIKHDVVLMNSGRMAVPPVLNDFLKKEGFTLYEPFASLKINSNQESRPIQIITAKSQPEMVDAILSAISVSSDRDRSLDVFAADNNGISLAVKAERYFERAGNRYVVTRFDGDPINYTLFRILETKGYRVVILEPKDDFRKVSEKLVSRMKMQGTYAQHNLLQGMSLGYSLQMSGIRLDDSSLPGGGVFLTNLTMDRIIRELLTENGYHINSR